MMNWVWVCEFKTFRRFFFNTHAHTDRQERHRKDLFSKLQRFFILETIDFTHNFSKRLFDSSKPRYTCLMNLPDYYHWYKGKYFVVLRNYAAMVFVLHLNLQVLREAHPLISSVYCR
jgi:hypothetical protein